MAFVSHGGVAKIGRGNGGFHSAARDFARYLASECEGLNVEPDRRGDAVGDAGAYARYAAEDSPTIRHLAVAPGTPSRTSLISPGQLEAMLSWQGIDGAGEHGIPRTNSVLALDKTFNVPKELSILAGLDVAFATELEAAIHAAVQVTVEALAAESVARVGPAGDQELVPVTWLEAAVAIHRTSRAGDPHWHAHTVLPTRVLIAVDGEARWAGLWTTPLFKDQRRLNRIFDAALLGNPRLRRVLLERDVAVREGTIVGIDGRLVAEFSRRHVQIEAAVAQLGAAWLAAHPGATPDAATVASWRERSQKLTRAEKDHTQSLETLRADWRRRAGRLGWAGGQARGSTPFRLEGQLDPHQIACRAVDRLGAEQSRWHDGEVQAKVFDELARADLVARDPARLLELGRQIGRLVLAEYCLPLLVGANGMDQARRARVRAWTSVEVVRQEQELRALLAARAHADGDVSPNAVRAVTAHAPHLLTDGQLVAAARIAGPESLVVIEGAAGAGKTTMLAAAARTLRATGARVLVLAPSATAAHVAGHETDTAAATLHGFLHAHGYQWTPTAPLHRLPPQERPVPPPDSRFWLRPGDVVLVDEAGMADQDTMRAVLTIAAETPGVRVRLIGDRAQLHPVGKGGVLAMAADLVPVTDLTDIRRFHHPGWANISLLIRDRDPRSFAHLVRAGAFVAARDPEITAARFAHDLATDLTAGHDALGIVTTNDQAAATNAAVQAALRAAGRTRPAPPTAVPGRDGLVAGIGDRITSRTNLATLGVLNRQHWTVTGHGPDGALCVRDDAGHRRTLPGPYVQAHTHLAYAVTAHGAQGRTVQTARLLADDATGATAYVGATRGRDANLIYLTAQDTTDAYETWTEILGRDDQDDGITIEAHKARRELDALGLHHPTPGQPAPPPRPHGGYQAPLRRRPSNSLRPAPLPPQPRPHPGGPHPNL